MLKCDWECISLKYNGISKFQKKIIYLKNFFYFLIWREDIIEIFGDESALALGFNIWPNQINTSDKG